MCGHAAHGDRGAGATRSGVGAVGPNPTLSRHGGGKPHPTDHSSLVAERESSLSVSVASSLAGAAARGRFHAGLRREPGGAFCDRNSARLNGVLGVETPIGLSFPDNRTGAAGHGAPVRPPPGPPTARHAPRVRRAERGMRLLWGER